MMPETGTANRTCWPKAKSCAASCRPETTSINSKRITKVVFRALSACPAVTANSVAPLGTRYSTEPAAAEYSIGQEKPVGYWVPAMDGESSSQLKPLQLSMVHLLRISASKRLTSTGTNPGSVSEMTAPSATDASADSLGSSLTAGSGSTGPPAAGTVGVNVVAEPPLSAKKWITSATRIPEATATENEKSHTRGPRPWDWSPSTRELLTHGG